MSIDNLQNTTGARPLPNGDPASWVYLAELVLPPEQQREVEQRCREYWWWERRRLRPWIEEEVKLRHFFPGQDVALKRTPQGTIILMVGDRYSPDFRTFLNGFPRPERCEIVVFSVSDPNDTTSIIG